MLGVRLGAPRLLGESKKAGFASIRSNAVSVYRTLCFFATRSCGPQSDTGHDDERNLIERVLKIKIKTVDAMRNVICGRVLKCPSAIHHHAAVLAEGRNACTLFLAFDCNCRQEG